MLHGQRLEQVKEEATRQRAQRLVDLLTEQLLQPRPGGTGARRRRERTAGSRRPTAAEERRREREQERLLALLNEQALEEETVEIELDPQYRRRCTTTSGGMSPDDLYDSFQDFMRGLRAAAARRGEARLGAGGAAHPGAAGGRTGWSIGTR